MLPNDTTMTRDRMLSAKQYAGLTNQRQVEDYAFYRHIRSRFVQLSAQYLGADLSESKVQSYCFSDVVHNNAITN